MPTPAEQYRDATKLNARIAIHKHGKGGWFRGLKALPPWKAGAKVLDLGSGTGVFWREETPLPPLDLTLVDLSPGLLAQAAKAVEAVGRTANAVEADAAALPFEDESFDGVLAVHMLYHVTPPEKGLAEIARILRPGGWALISSNCTDGLAELYRISAGIWGVDPRDPAAVLFGLDTHEDMVRAHFETVSIHRLDDTLVLPDAEEVLAYMLSFPPGDGASPAEVAAARAAIEAAMSAGGGVLITAKRQGAFLCFKGGYDA